VPYDAEKGNFTLALAGDTMLTRKLIPFKEINRRIFVAGNYPGDSSFSKYFK